MEKMLKVKETEDCGHKAVLGFTQMEFLSKPVGLFIHKADLYNLL